MVALMLAALLGWGFFLWIGTLFGALVPGVLESRSCDRRGGDVERF